MKAISDDVVASYHRCRHTEASFDTLYELFLGKSPEIASMFVRTDFVLQKLMMKQSLLEMLNHYCGVEAVRPEIERLGKLHHQIAVRPEHYDLWLDSLCEAVAKHDPEYEVEQGERWRAAMRPGIALMLSVSDGVG